MHNSDKTIFDKIPRPLPLYEISHFRCPYRDDQSSSCDSDHFGHEGDDIQAKTLEFSIRIVYKGSENVSLETIERIENDIVEGLNEKRNLEYQRSYCFPVHPLYTARRAGLGVLELVEDDHQHLGGVEFKS